jgi:hypothetical protein
MTVKERLLQVIDQMSEDSLAELLEVLLHKQRQNVGEISNNPPTSERKKSRVKALQGWFEKTVPAPADFDEDEAKWEYLKAKHNL